MKYDFFCLFLPPLLCFKTPLARVFMYAHTCVCVCVQALRCLYLVGYPSKLIIISKHDRVDKMSCAPPDLLSDRGPYLWWWTDVALAWPNRSLRAGVGVRTAAHTQEGTHQKAHACRRTHTRWAAHTRVTFKTWPSYLWPLQEILPIQYMKSKLIAPS